MHNKFRTPDYDRLVSVEDQKRLEACAEHITTYMEKNYSELSAVVCLAPKKNLTGDGQGVPSVFGLSPGTPNEIFMILNMVHDKSLAMLKQFDTDSTDLSPHQGNA